MPIARRTWSGGKTDRDPKRNDADNKLLLIYPLDVEEIELSAAASGLKELGGDLLGLDQANARSVQGQLDKGNTAKRTKKQKKDTLCNYSRQ